MSKPIYAVLAAITVIFAVLAIEWHWVGWFFVLIVPAWLVALADSSQINHTIMRNFPLIGHGRWIMEFIRPYVRQYFVESATEGTPINRMFRAIVYERAKGDMDTNPYGTKLETYHDGYEWMGHSLAAINVEELEEDPRVLIGGEACKQPYSASILNISAMSFGALSNNAIRALNKGAKAGNFFHNTGEGSLSPYHLENGGDICWQIGTAYFGCRKPDGRFDPDIFKEKAAEPSVKMIEIKLSQGAKPGHGGILPASKNSPEIAAIRLVEPGKDVVSPSTHSEFSTPRGLLEYVQRLRELSGGKPVGFKLCVGRREEFISICKAMVATGIKPDFITVDGGEGGTGAAPLEYSNSVGMPLREGLAFVVDCLVGFELRSDIRVIASGKIFTGFHLAKNMALGADMCNSARGMMLALGCIHVLRCNTNRCPTGITTQDPKLIQGLVVEDKYKRVARFHKETVDALRDLISSAGLRHPSDLHRHHIFRRVNQFEIMRYDQIFPSVDAGSFNTPPYPGQYAQLAESAVAERFG